MSDRDKEINEREFERLRRKINPEMSEIEEKIKKLICIKCHKSECMVPFNEACDYRNRFTDDFLSLIQIEVDCKDCIEGLSDPDRNVKCEICKGTGKITKPVKSGDEGIIK